MNELPTKYKKRIARFLPIETEGLTLYPVTVENLEEFQRCVPALQFLRSGLPVALMQIPLLDALFRLEIASSASQEGGEETGPTPFSDICFVLCLALRLGQDEERNKMLERVSLIFDENDPATIDKIIFKRDDGFLITVTPRQFGRLRPILAAQNGVKLYDETENAKLIYADRVLRAQKGPKLEEDLADKVAWCAALCHAEEAEIYDWPILKFNKRCDTLQRSLDYVIFGTGAASGLVKYDGGPPVPSPYFAKRETIADRLLHDGTPAADEAVRAGLEKAEPAPPKIQ